MKFNVLTLFPGMFAQVLGDSILGRARENKIIEIGLHNIRDYAANKHRKVDDYPYGGGTGMVMMAQPVFDAWKDVKNPECKSRTIYLSPQGQVFSQEKAKELTQYDQVILLCGHYEGVDERVIEEIADEEISLGDFVLTGGEIAAMAVIDCVSRLIPGVLPSEEAFTNESLTNNLLEYPQYTRPEAFRCKKVPEVLISGHHKNIEDWRLEQSIQRTLHKRPDLYKKWEMENGNEQ